jgi:hypothetical protein
MSQSEKEGDQVFKTHKVRNLGLRCTKMYYSITRFQHESIIQKLNDELETRWVNPLLVCLKSTSSVDCTHVKIWNRLSHEYIDDKVQILFISHPALKSKQPTQCMSFIGIHYTATVNTNYIIKHNDSVQMGLGFEDDNGVIHLLSVSTCIHLYDDCIVQNNFDVENKLASMNISSYGWVNFEGIPIINTDVSQI